MAVYTRGYGRCVVKQRSLTDAQPGESPAEKSVLIADNKRPFALYTRRILETSLGCTVAVAANGAEALTQLHRINPHVFICEMMMPGLHGMDLVREARNGWAEMGIIVMTAQPLRFPYMESVRAGATDFLHKPFLPAELEAKVSRIFAEQALRRERNLEERKYRSLFELSIDGMVLLGRDGRSVEDANPAFLELCGFRRDDLVGRSILESIADEDQRRFEQWLGLCSLIGRGSISDLRLAGIRGARYAEVSLTAVRAEEDSNIFLAVKDITERREVQLRLAEAAQRDALTGLFNRRAFSHQLYNATRAVQEKGIAVTLCIFDLDSFKICNDVHGHQAGDQILKQAGDAITRSIRSSTGDAGFRFGGDEFAVLLQGVGVEEAHGIARRIQEEFQQHETYGVTMSIGLAQYLPNQGIEDLIRAADQAMYRAKNAGKNTIAF